MTPTQTATPDIDADIAEWTLDSWQCARRGVELICEILDAATRGPLTLEQRYRLQFVIDSLSRTVEITNLSHLFLTPDEYAAQDALYLNPDKGFSRD